MFTVESYNTFFREAAVKHINILHNVAAESQDGPVAEASFFIGIDSAINGVRTQQTTANCTLIVLKYESKGRDNGAFDYRARYTGGFLVCKSADVSDIDAVELAEATAEETAWDIINLIIQSRVGAGGLPCSSPFGEVDMSDVSMTHVGPFLDKQFGWLVEFEFVVTKNSLINPARIISQFS